MASIQNDNRDSSTESDEGVIKVVVIGEPDCGKTRFIRAYYDYHYGGFMYIEDGVMVYPCELEGHERRAKIYEIPGYSEFSPRVRRHHYKRADILVFMYAIDDPSSFHMLMVKWIGEAMNIIISRDIPVIFIGTKLDLRDDQQVIERLALENQSPVTCQQGKELLLRVPHKTDLIECSANVDQVEDAFKTIFDLFLANE